MASLQRNLGWLIRFGLLFSLALYGRAVLANSTAVFINEIHYDNAGTDSGEGVEIAGPAGTELSGWQVVLYNGANNRSYGTIQLSGTIPNLSNGFGVRAFFKSGLQNGAPDGLALVDAQNRVVQFLSYEGTLTAEDGPAAGQTSNELSASETTSTPPGHSLQLSGSGAVYEDFTWQAPAAHTFEFPNTQQIFLSQAFQPHITVFPDSLDFGQVTVGDSSAAQAVTIENVGEAELLITAIGVGNDDFILEDLPALPVDIAPGDQRIFGVRYQPTAGGESRADLEIRSNSPDIPTVVLSLTGTGIEDAGGSLHDYLMLAGEEVELKRVDYTAGMIHANEEVQFEKGAGRHDGSVTAVRRVEIDPGITVHGDITAPQVEQKGKVTGAINRETVRAVSLPAVPPVSPGTSDVEVKKRETRFLDPGSYGDLDIGRKATLHLQTGVYTARQLELSKESRLVVDVTAGEVQLSLAEELELSKRAAVEIVGGPATRFVVYSSATRSDISIGQNARFRGTIVAPYADIEIHKKAYVQGSLCGKHIEVKRGATVVHHSVPALAKNGTGDREEKSVLASAIPEKPELRQNFPNPFNPSTVIPFVLPRAGEISLKIYNLRGQLVRTLAAGNFPAGDHQLRWDATSDRGETVSSGYYFYQLRSGNFRQMKKMLLIK